MYGPSIPTTLASTMPSEMPVWRRHVGCVSMHCKLTAKKVMVTQNLTANVSAMVTVA